MTTKPKTFCTFILPFLLFICYSCKSRKSVKTTESALKNNTDFTIAFGSCNKQDKPNLLWDDIIDIKPDVWIWGGDNIYADTEDMAVLREMYKAQNEVKEYQELKAKTQIIGTWDDHDYGVNDGGTEFRFKKESQQEFLTFIGVRPDSPRRGMEGIYTSHDYKLPKGKIKIIVLDTRYFRTDLTSDSNTEKRFKPNTYGQGTILGETQWQWLESELRSSKADFNLVVSSIQVLSHEHGFETWGNFPHEVDKLKKIVVTSKAKGVIILSGDRHISEFSRAKVNNLPYPLIDFTSSGLTHAYTKYSGEPNQYRIGRVVSTESFGLLKFDFDANRATMFMLGDNAQELGTLQQAY